LKGRAAIVNNDKTELKNKLILLKQRLKKQLQQQQ